MVRIQTIRFGITIQSGSLASAGVFGSSFTYTDVGGSNFAITGGTITGAYYDTSTNTFSNPFTADIYITGLSLNAATLSTLVGSGLTATQQNNLYWRTVLSGDDVVTLGDGSQSITFAGDGNVLEAGQYIVGGSDMISGGSSGRFDLW